MNSPSVAIVVPVFNERSLIDDLIVCLQDVGADEIVFVDGGSSDGTQEILHASGMQWQQAKPCRALQMNAGAAQCVSDVLLFLHADTSVYSCHISAVKKAMRDGESVAGRFDVSLTGTHPMFRVIERMINLRSRLSRISTGDQVMFVRRRIFEQIDGFPEQELMEDVEISKRLKRLGQIACLRQEVETSSRRWEETGIFRTILLMWQLRFRYWLGADPADLKRLYRDST